MTSSTVLLVGGAASLLWLFYAILEPLFLSPLAKIPGPKLFALTHWRLAYEDWKGTRTQTIHALHRQYGTAVRIGPDEVSFTSLSALRTIYGPGSRYGRTSFYRMFDVYGRQNLFTFHSSVDHGRRKKLVSFAYSKTNILDDTVAGMVEGKVEKYMKLIDSEPEHVSDVFSTLHYYSLDSITGFLYGKYGSTSAMDGTQAHRALISDILDPARRTFFWSMQHLPWLTRWLYSRSDLTERLIRPVLPMQKPTTYTGIRAFALDAYNRFRQDMENGKFDGDDGSILARLWKHSQENKNDRLDHLDIASECADHFLAGIDTTSDTLMFLIWALSQPGSRKYQEKLRQEVLSISEEALTQNGNPRAAESDKCTYLHAIIKETLRLYAPLPSSEPRSLDVDSEIDGFLIPAHTVVSMAPYSLHRNPEIFPDTLEFNPDRWLGPDAKELNRWFWAFSSGGRMCVGMHLAMAEMTTLAATIYRKYETVVADGFQDATPGITARFEVFYDPRFPRVTEGYCPIKFQELQ